VALFGYYEGGARLETPHEGNIFCAAFEDGWFWYIPLGPGLTSVGAVVGSDRTEGWKCDLDVKMKQLIEACPSIMRLLTHAKRITAGPYGQLRLRQDYSYTTESFWKPGIAVIGDSACFVDPVFSSGVHLATYAALLVARSVNSVMNGSIDERRAFAEFEGRYRREYALFYDFLLAFYDSNRLPGRPFWDDRTIAGSEEIRNEAFISLVAGLGTSGESLYPSDAEGGARREGLSASLFPHGSPVGGRDPDLERRRVDFYKSFLRESICLQLQGALGSDRPREDAVLSEGLIPSCDGLHWIDPSGL
jgi:halogenation protein CepH